MNNYYLNEPEQLKDPFIAYCIFAKFCRYASMGESKKWIEFNTKLVNGPHFLAWLFTKNYIDEQLVNKLSAKHFITVHDIFNEIFKNFDNCNYIIKAKSYSLLAKYASENDNARESVFITFVYNQEKVMMSAIEKSEMYILSNDYSVLDFKEWPFEAQYNYIKKISINECNNLLTREKLKKYQELKKQANYIYKEVKSDLLERAVDVLKWKNENLNTKYVLDYSKDIDKIINNTVVIVVYERWAYGGAEDHYYSIKFDEIFSEEWKEKAIKELNEKKLKEEKEKKELEEKQKLQKEEDERREYQRLKSKFEK